MNLRFLQSIKIDKGSRVADIVANDYRTADVFLKYGIGFCCGGKAPLSMACEMNGVEERMVIGELEEATRDINHSNTLDFNAWHIDFLTDYIVNVHHDYTRKALPLLQEYVDRFAEGHSNNFDYLPELQRLVRQLIRNFLPHLEQEEAVVFPYIRQIGHAYYSRESYASLLVRTLRKPVEDIMQNEHDKTARILRRLRELSNNYSPPPNACISHRVAFLKLKEVDNDLVQHLYLENNILFPKAVVMENELLLKQD